MSVKNKAETPWLLRNNKDTHCGDCGRKFKTFWKKNICWDCSKTICSKCSVKVRDKKFSLLRRKKFCKSCHEVKSNCATQPTSEAGATEEIEQLDASPLEILPEQDQEEEVKTRPRKQTLEPKEIPHEITQFLVSVGYGPFQMAIVQKRCTVLERNGVFEAMLSNMNATTPAEIVNKNPNEEYESHAQLNTCEAGMSKRVLRLQDNRQLVCNMVQLEESSDHPSIRNEVYMMRSQHHPNVVSYLDAFHFEGYVYCYYDQAPYCLDEFIQSRRRMLDEESIAYILQQVLLGLESLHYEDRVHRDVTSKNIFLGPNGEVTLGDFGYLFQQRFNPISPFWTAPELIHTHMSTTKTDIWNIGTLAFYMLEATDPYVGEPLFDALLKQSAGQPPKIRDRKKWSSAILNFIKVCHQANPDKRPEAHVLLKHQIMDEVNLATRDTFSEFVRGWKGVY